MVMDKLVMDWNEYGWICVMIVEMLKFIICFIFLRTAEFVKYNHPGYHSNRNLILVMTYFQKIMEKMLCKCTIMHSHNRVTSYYSSVVAETMILREDCSVIIIHSNTGPNSSSCHFPAFSFRALVFTATSV